MRSPATKRKPFQQPIVAQDSRPAPVLGWNARDPVAAMPPGYAIVLDNWYPRESDVIVRTGAVNFATGFDNPVCTLMTWRPQSASNASKFFAVTSDGLYDITAGGIFSLGDEVASVTEPFCQYTNIKTAGGNYLIVVNGSDDLARYDGTSWTTVASYAITGGGTLLTENIINLATFKRRLFFVRKNSTFFYYLPIDSIGGDVGQFDLGAVFSKGGRLVAIGNWTVDGGSGVDDLIFFISSQGQVAVFQGTDPADANSWAVVGVWDIAQPIGNRCVQKLGSDVLILTRAGIFPLTAVMSGKGAEPTSAVTDTISLAHSSASSKYNGNRGWQMFVDVNDSTLLLNVPQTEFGTAVQHVRNLKTGAWCRFTRWNATSWEEFNSQNYFGTGNSVVRAFTGSTDFDGTIPAQAQTAYDYLNPRSGNKSIQLVRPTLQSSGSFGASFGISADFSDTVLLNPLSALTPSGSNWDEGLWDQAVWGGSNTVTRGWGSAAAWPGYCFSTHLRASLKSGTLSWTATDFVFQIGATL